MLVPLLLAALPQIAHPWVVVMVHAVAAVVAVQYLEGLPWLLLTCQFFVLLVESVYLLSHRRYFIYGLLYVCEIHLRRCYHIYLPLEYAQLLLQYRV